MNEEKIKRAPVWNFLIAGVLLIVVLVFNIWGLRFIYDSIEPVGPTGYTGGTGGSCTGYTGGNVVITDYPDIGEDPVFEETIVSDESSENFTEKEIFKEISEKKIIKEIPEKKIIKEIPEKKIIKEIPEKKIIKEIPENIPLEILDDDYVDIDEEAPIEIARKKREKMVSGRALYKYKSRKRFYKKIIK